MGLLDLLFTRPELFVIYLIALVYGITVHEFSHAYVAYIAGDNDQIINKRLSLNPLRHLDVVGMIALILIGIGWGKPVSINLNKFNSKKFKFYLYAVSLSGIIVNLLSALLFAFILKMLLIFNFVNDSSLLISFLVILINTNIVLAVFNLIPIPPLDGSKVLNLLLPDKFNKFKVFLMTNGNNVLFGLLILSSLANISIFSYLYNPVIGFVYRIFGL